MVALLPIHTWMSAPSWLPRTSRTRLTVTGLPMSSSRPVPGCRVPKPGVAYQELDHGRAPGWVIRDQMLGVSALAVPRGPTADTDVTRSVRSAGDGLSAAVAGGAADETAPSGVLA